MQPEPIKSDTGSKISNAITDSMIEAQKLFAAFASNSQMTDE